MGVSVNEEMHSKAKGYVNVAQDEKHNGIQLPIEKDNSLKIETVLSKFSGCFALAYRCPNSGAWRLVEKKKENFVPPRKEWGSTKYICVKGKRVKFKLTNLPTDINKEILHDYLDTFGIVDIKTINKKSNTTYVIIRFITHADLENMRNMQYSFTIEEVMEADSEKFTKRSGTTDMGHIYEETTMAYCLLNLTLDENVEDFRLSSNDEEFGSFDDIIAYITFTNGDVRKYAIQVKYKKEDKSLKSHLTSTTGDFSIQKYFTDFMDMIEYTKSYNLILFTNLQFDTQEGELLKFGSTNIKLKIVKVNSFKEFGSGSCYKFCPENVDISDEYKHFFDKFLLYSNQSNLEAIEQNLQFAKCNPEFWSKYFDIWINFISEWSNKVRKKRLNKIFVKESIALQMLAPYIELFPYKDKEDTEETSLIKKAMLSFTVTIVDEAYSENIKNVWENENVSESEIERIIKDFQLKNIGNNEKRVVALWIMDKCPLIVTENEIVCNVISSLCREKKFIILKKNSNPIPVLSVKEVKAFTKLSDLQFNSTIYDDITETFYCSLQGKETINLHKLIKQCKNLENIITTNELIKMVTGPFAIGEPETALKLYIDRFVTRLTIDYGFFDKVDNDTLVIISCQGNGSILKNRLPSFKLLINIEDYLDQGKEQFESGKQVEHFHSIDGKAVYFSEQYCPQDKFDIICQEHPNRGRCHHFRIVEDGTLEWIYSKGKIGDISIYRTNNCSLYLKETDLINNERAVNVITANPGMGKTELMKKLFSCYWPSFWTILISVRDWSEYLNRKDCNNETFFQAVMEKKCRTHLERDIFQIMKNTKSITFFWDGLDELSNSQIYTTMNLINDLVVDGFKHWISCRKHVEDKLEKKFNVFSRSIKEFDKDEQNNYIYKRLKNTDIESCVQKIQDYIGTVQYNEILGIPLQIFMLTELLLNKPEIYDVLLNKVFPITDLYQYFIEMKFHIFFQDKYKISKSNFLHEHMMKKLREEQLKYLQKSAVLIIVEDNFLSKLDIDFYLAVSVDETVTYGVGIITGKTDDGKSRFLHFSYAEYLVALYLYEYRNKTGNTIREHIFEERYRNIRFMFDLLLSKNCPAHLAVLYNNFDYLKSCQNFKCQDEGGRNPLQIACAWGPRFPKLKTEQRGDDLFIDDKQVSVSLSNTQHYDEMICFLLKHNNIFDKDYLFDLNCIQYLDLALSLKPLLIFLEKKLLPFEELKNFNIFSVLYYSVKFNNSLVLRGLQDIPVVKTSKSCNSILHLASENNSIDCIKLLLNNEKYQLEINSKNDYGETPIHVAAENGHYELVKYLVQLGADVNIREEEGSNSVHVAAANRHKGTVKEAIKPKADQNANAKKKSSTPIYRAALKGHSDIVKFLVESGANVNIPNQDGWVPLHAAAENGDIKTVKHLVNAKSDLNARTIRGSTPIYRAAVKGHCDVVKYLAESGANINIKGQDGWTPIHAAAEYGHIEIVKLLVRLKCNVNAKSTKNFTPIYRAARNGHYEVIKYLAQSGADVNIKDQDGWTSLHAAAENGHIDIVKLLVNDLKVNVNERTLKGTTPICCAAGKGHNKIVEYLISSGADINMQDQEGWAPVFVAAKNGHFETVILLSKLSANMNAKHKDGFTLIYFAALKGYYKLVEYLVKSGTNVNIQGEDGWIPIHAAAGNGHMETVKLLVGLGSNVNARNKEDFTPIYLAAQEGHYEIVKYLAESGADVNIQNQDGWTPIHAAAENGHIEVIKLLVKFKGNLNAKTTKGSAPIYRAALKGHYKVVKYITESGADVNVQDQDGFTPIHGAAENGHIETVKLLVNHKSNVNAKSKKGNTPIYRAALKGHYEVVEYLAQSGADVNIQNENDQAPIHAAAFSGHNKTVKLLIRLKSNVNAKNKEGVTPIYLGARYGHHQIVRYLAESGADINIQNPTGWTPMHIAAYNGHLEIVKLLVNLKAKVNAKTIQGSTPRHLAGQKGHNEIVEWLKASRKK